MVRSMEGVKRGRWTPYEREMFEKLLHKHGKEWKKIAEVLKTRTVVQVRTHAQKYFKKLAKKTGTSALSTSKKQGLFLNSSQASVVSDDSSDTIPNTPDDDHLENPINNLDKPVSSSNIHQNFAVAIAPQDEEQVIQSANGSAGTSLRTRRRASRETVSILGLDAPEFQIDALKLHPAVKRNPSDSDDAGEPRRSRRVSRRWSSITPRTMAAATILAAPHMRKNSEEGPENGLDTKLNWAMATLEETGSKSRNKRSANNSRSRGKKRKV